MYRVIALFEAQDEISRVAANIARNAEGMTRSAGSNVSRAMDVAGSAVSSMLSLTSKGVTSVAGAAVAMNKAFDFGETLAGFDRMETAGRNLADSLGADYDEIVTRVTDASLGAVSQMDAMQATNRAMMLGLGADAEQLANLMEVAAFRGRAMGVDTTQAFNDIVTGIGRMSPMILDNLGIVLDADTRYKAWADEMGRSVDTLSDLEKRQILFSGVLETGNQMLAEAGGLAADNVTTFERLDATLDDAKFALGEINVFGRTFVGWLADGAEGATVLVEGIVALQDAVEESAEAAENATGSYEEYLGLQLKGNVILAVLPNLRRLLIQGIVEEGEAVTILNDQLMDYLGIVDEVTQATLAEANSHDQALLARMANVEAAETVVAATEEQAAATEHLITVEEMLADMTRRNNDSWREFEVLMRGPVGEAQAQFQQQLEDIMAQQGNAEGQIAALGAAYHDNIGGIIVDLATMKAQQDGVFSDAEYQAIAQFAEAYGLVDAGTAATAAAISRLTNDLNAGRISQDQYVEGLGMIAGQVEAGAATLDEILAPLEEQRALQEKVAEIARLTGDEIGAQADTVAGHAAVIDSATSTIESALAGTESQLIETTVPAFEALNTTLFADDGTGTINRIEFLTNTTLPEFDVALSATRLEHVEPLTLAIGATEPGLSWTLLQLETVYLPAVNTALGVHGDRIDEINGQYAGWHNTLKDVIGALVYINELTYRQTGGGTFPEGVPPLTGPGGQHGLAMTVPPGFPNDTFPVFASSGEDVFIVPEHSALTVAGESAPSGTVVYETHYHDETRVTAHYRREQSESSLRRDLQLARALRGRP